MTGATTIATIAAGALSAGAGLLQANKQEKAQRAAMDQAKKNAQAQADQAAQDFNRANQKSADVSALADANAKAAMGGVGSTMLTGPGGVDPTQLQLGKSTLLGG